MSKLIKNQRFAWNGFLLVVALLVATSVAAQQPRIATVARHSLWKVEGKHSTVYLMGSVHVLKAENYPLAPELEAAFTNSAVVAFETDIAAMDDPETQQKITSKGQLPEGETLATQLSPAVYTRLTKHLEEAGLPELMVARLKPSLVAMTLQALELQKFGLDPEYGLDKHFFKQAREEHKTIVPLDTVDFQISLVTDFSKEEGELLMKTTLEGIDKTKKELGELLKAWQTGNADKLERLHNEGFREVPAIFKRLVADRNQRWVPKLEEWLGGLTNVVVIVGTAHLVGKEGVAELLRKKGYKVTQQ
jgi:uncharacterized protein